MTATTQGRPVLTWRQAKALRFIRAHTREHGCPPSLREVRDACGLSSLSGTAHLLGRLAEKGYITREPGRARAIRVEPGEPA